MNLYNGILNLIYPPSCLHCKTHDLKNEAILCDTCLSMLELIDFKEHCPKCFSLKFCPKKHACANCSKKQSSLTGVAAAFEYMGPASSLIKKLKFADKPYLAEGLAGFMAAQFIELNWQLPDIIIPVPQSFAHFLKRGYNQAELLSLTLADILKCPTVNALKRSSEDYSQAGLNHEQRLKLTGNTISLKKNQNLQDKVILLVDDVLTTGTTLQKCAEVLLESYPNSIYALTACCTVN